MSATTQDDSSPLAQDRAAGAAGAGRGPQGAGGGTRGKGGAGPRGKSVRRLAREFAVQGLYEWQLSRAEAAAIDANLREHEGFARSDTAHFDALLNGIIGQSAALDERLATHLDRKPAELSPVEHAVLWVGAYELMHCLDVPYRVVINEGVELAKTFGGTDGHKYVNGVLDKLAADLRPAEVAKGRGPRR